MKNKEQIVEFGTHVRKLREEKGMSQQQLADMSDVSKLTIQRTELAKFAVTIDVLISISKGLDISLSELVDFEKE